jgi:hypothetical protein
MPHPPAPLTIDLTGEFITEVTDQAIPHHPDRVVSVEQHECEAAVTAGSD